MAPRAIHLETSNSLDTDSFINALRRFISRRGPVRQLRRDQGTNFVGAPKELAQALNEMDQEIIKAKLLQEQCSSESHGRCAGTPNKNRSERSLIAVKQ